MAELISFLSTMGHIFEKFGPSGVILLLWWLNNRDTQKILMTYRDDMEEQREMYENNVELVKRVLTIAEEQQDVIIMNTRIQQSLVDRIESNQFCPLMKMQKVPGKDIIQG